MIPPTLLLKFGQRYQMRVTRGLRVETITGDFIGVDNDPTSPSRGLPLFETRRAGGELRIVAAPADVDIQEVA